MYIHTYIRTYIHTYIHIHTRTRTCAPSITKPGNQETSALKFSTRGAVARLISLPRTEAERQLSAIVRRPYYAMAPRVRSAVTSAIVAGVSVVDPNEQIKIARCCRCERIWSQTLRSCHGRQRCGRCFAVCKAFSPSRPLPRHLESFDQAFHGCWLSPRCSQALLQKESESTSSGHSEKISGQWMLFRCSANPAIDACCAQSRS